MSWTAPRTWVASEVVTASLMNTHVRDNLLETAVAKVTTQGDLVYATGANALARLAKGTAYQVLRMNSGATAPEWTQGDLEVIKSADESVTSSTTLQDDDQLVFAIPASEVWYMDMMLIVDGNSTADFKAKFTVPASCVMGWIIRDHMAAGGSTSVRTIFTEANTALVEIDGSAGRAYPYVRIEAYIVNSTNAGTIQLQWAQNTSNATATTVKKGSWLRARKLA